MPQSPLNMKFTNNESKKSLDRKFETKHYYSTIKFQAILFASRISLMVASVNYVCCVSPLVILGRTVFDAFAIQVCCTFHFWHARAHINLWNAGSLKRSVSLPSWQAQLIWQKAWFAPPLVSLIWPVLNGVAFLSFNAQDGRSRRFNEIRNL